MPIHHITHNNVLPTVFDAVEERLRRPRGNGSVEHVVLHEEEHVEDHRRDAQPKLDDVAGDAAPVVLVGAVEDELERRESAAREVEQNVVDWPSYR